MYYNEEILLKNQFTCLNSWVQLSSQDCNSGRDATDNITTDGVAGFSFTKLDINGVPLPSSALSWSCVRDNVTGLTWEVKTDDSGIHDRDVTYKWGGVSRQGDGFGVYFNDWNNLVSNSIDTNFCGKSNWRVPTANELVGIVNYNEYEYTIDLDYFPNTQNSSYWSATPSNQNIESARDVSFVDGISSHVALRANSLHVRLVSSEE